MGILHIPLPRPCSKSYAETTAALQRDGFAAIRSVLDVDALRQLVGEYERKILPHKYNCEVRREKHGDAPRVVHLSNVCEFPDLAHLAADPRLLKIASACLGGVGVRPIINTELFDKPPHGEACSQTPPHQDNYYFKAKEPGIALWIPLDEVDTNSGTLRYVQGSHLRGLRFHDFDWGPYGGFAKQIVDFTDEDDEHVRDAGHLDPGDVVVHHGLTIHYAPPNMTSTRRRGLVVNYIAEHAAFTLEDDLYIPALVFNICEAGNLKADVPDRNWPERRALAVTSVQCALRGWRGVQGGIHSTVRIDEEANTLVVEVIDHLLQRPVVNALVESGHMVKGVERVCSMPLGLGSFQPPMPPRVGPSNSNRLPVKCCGVWARNCGEALPGTKTGTTQLTMRLYTPSGVYVDFSIPGSMLDARFDVVDSDDFDGLMLLAEQRCSAGVLSAHGAEQDIIVRHHSVDFHPFDGTVDVRRICWQGKDDSALLETSMPGHSRDYKETWHRVDEPFEPDNVAALELVDDQQGRLGFWVVIGTWFARVVGRRPEDILTDVVCKSLPHVLKTYAEALGIEPEAATHGYEATFGRVEAPGVFRVFHDFDPTRTDPLFLDDSKRQLRRDSVNDDVIVEVWSSQRWKIRELPRKCTAFGKLKRLIA